MRTICFRILPILVLSCFLAPTFQPAYADPADPPATSPDTYPQIVRISFVQGDVRISRGKQADKQNHDSTGWEQAVADLPVASGDSIVTGTGRAEIEFEDASTVYLADNSVLALSEITSTGGVPYTEISLISGTATMNVHPMVAGEWFKVTTPTDTLSLEYPRKAVWRIDSYLDAVSITPQHDPLVSDPEVAAAQSAMVGKTTSYKHGVRVASTVTTSTGLSSEWDNWVEARLTARTRAMNEAVKDAGLKSPVPGLEQLNGKGHFFACEPYGTCWEPTNGWDGKATQVAEAKTEPSATPAEPDASLAQSTAAVPNSKPAKAKKPSATDAYLAVHPGATLYTEDYLYPCNAFAVREVMAIDPVTGKPKLIDSYFDLGSYSSLVNYPTFVRHPYLFMGYDQVGFGMPWEWAICHTGSWIRWRHRYVWVAGTRRHHRCPVRWVRNGRNVGFVPLHPKDVAGNRPINLKDGLFKMTPRKGQPVEHIAFEAGKPISALDRPPKEFRQARFEELKSADVPHAEAHSAFETARTGKGPLPGKDASPAKGTAFAGSAMAKNPEVRSSQTREQASERTHDQGTPILFDRKSQTFSVERQINQGSAAPTTVREPLGGRGDYQAGYGGAQSRPTSTGGRFPNGENASRSYTPPNNSGNNGNSSRSYSPSPSYNSGNNGGGSRSYSPPPSNGGGNSNNGGGARSYSPPPPSYSPPPPPPPPPAPSYSPPSSSSHAPAGPLGH